MFVDASMTAREETSDSQRGSKMTICTISMHMAITTETTPNPWCKHMQKPQELGLNSMHLKQAGHQHASKPLFTYEVKSI